MIELTEGQELSVTGEDGESLTRVQMAVGWDHSPTAGFMGSGAAPIDLDASAIQFAGEQFFDLAFFNHLATRDGSVVHLGDNTTGKGEGDDEVITVDLGRVYPRVDTILFMVSSYQGHSLEFIRNAYCRLIDDAGTELARFTLTLGVRETGLVMAKLFRDGPVWKLRPIGTGIALKTPTDDLDALQPFLQGSRP
ncbi:MAG: TerD family protein [Terrabacter sp.]|nr:TerD family protein [Terrabacter sp.]